MSNFFIKESELFNFVNSIFDHLCNHSSVEQTFQNYTLNIVYCQSKKKLAQLFLCETVQVQNH